jgi:putative membrane-bound dehydrogenase-like protein
VAALAAGLLPIFGSAGGPGYDVPVVHDSRLEVVLFASDPEIVTPIGAVVDAAGALLVVESHTHSAPSDYPGPKADRIKRLVDTDGDGRADRITIFADGLHEAMNLALDPAGVLHAVTAKEVIRLADENGDGRSDPEERTRLLHLETESGNPHGNLLALTIADDGTLYVARGNVGGHPYAWVSRAGERIAGYGEGGDIVRLAPDGSGLRVVATGFWNPFALGFDGAGRLLCADNDPDSRGPNRVVHVIDGGDYGFLARYGPSGLHPFSGWDADLPGVLPIAATTGEAPSGLLDLTSAGLGGDYAGTFAVTVWGEHHVELYRSRPAGVSFTATGERWIEGGGHFRPVALAATAAGGSFITDWVLKDYPNHSRGAIWLVRPRVPVDPGEQATSAPAPAAGAQEIARVRALRDIAALRPFLGHEDAFFRATAVAALAESAARAELAGLLTAPGEAERVGAWLALRQQRAELEPAWVERALGDASAELRLLALRHIADRVDRTQRAAVGRLMEDAGLSAPLFRAALATLQVLSSTADQDYAAGKPTFSIPRPAPVELLPAIVANPRLPAAIRALAVPQLALPLDDATTAVLIDSLAPGENETFAREAIRTLCTAVASEALPALRALAADATRSPELRADAVSALGQVPGWLDGLEAGLLGDPVAAVRLEAVRVLRLRPVSAEMLDALRAAMARHPNDTSFVTAGRRVLGETPDVAPTDLTGWLDLLAEGGNVRAGERVFFEDSARCISCHRVQNRGNAVGPDLSLIGRTQSRARLTSALLRPSDDVSPEYQGWEVRLKDGSSVIGLQLHLRGWGLQLDTLDGRNVRIRNEDIAGYDAMQRSLMPEGLEHMLPAGDIRNLIAYLESLR